MIAWGDEYLRDGTKKRNRTAYRYLPALLLALALLFCSCAGGITRPPPLSNPAHVRQHPPLRLPECAGHDLHTFNDDQRNALLDLSNLRDGYVAAACTAPAKAMLRLTCGDSQYAYRLNNQGKTEFFPLSMGPGDYLFEVFVHLYEDTYENILSADCHVMLGDELAPFLMPHALVQYDENSAVVALARSLAQNASSDLEVVQQIHHWMAHHFTYDDEKAEQLRDTRGYIPDLDALLKQEKGICYDYAALTAALLRANGIPCKLVIGMVSGDGQETVLHAWNKVWLNEGGSICKGLDAEAGQWTRLDLTMAAAIGPENYKQLSENSHYLPQSEH